MSASADGNPQMNGVHSSATKLKTLEAQGRKPSVSKKSGGDSKQKAKKRRDEDAMGSTGMYLQGNKSNSCWLC
jgi:hypothetical protein